MRNEPDPNIQSYDNTCLAGLPKEELDKRRYSIYLIDYHWNYLFVNDYALARLGNVSIVGKNVEEIWKDFPHLNLQPLYNLLRDGVASKSAISTRSTSPFTNKTIDIKGVPLSDCYYFSVVELPDKDSLISELKAYLKKGEDGLHN